MLAFTAAVLSFFALAAATPAKRAAPEVTYPHDATVWQLSHHHNVTWSTDGASGTGDIFLAKGGVTDPNPLATGVSLTEGRTIIMVPSVTPGSDYTVLLNVSGQTSSSPQFAIVEVGGSVASSATGTSASASATTPVATATSTTVVTPGSSSSASGSASSAASSASSAASSVSSAASSASSAGSSALSSLSSSAASAASSLSSALSSGASSISASLSTATSPSGSTSSASSTSSSSTGVALKYSTVGVTGAALSALLVLASGAFML